MHGHLFNLKCSVSSCGYIEPNVASPICESLRGTEYMVEKGVLDPEIPASTLPRCSKCNALARPGVVWFGETIPALKAIDALVARADLCLVVGTSSMVSSHLALKKAFYTDIHSGSPCGIVCIKGTIERWQSRRVQY